MLKLLTYIPSYHYKTIYDIDYNRLKEMNKSVVLFDLDNTILPYHLNVIDDKIRLFLDELEKEFLVIIISNSTKKRVKFALNDNYKYIAFSIKPLKKGFKKAMKKYNFNKNDAIMISRKCKCTYRRKNDENSRFNAKIQRK